MNQPKNLLDIDTFSNKWNYSSLQILKYLNSQKNEWSREELEVYLDNLLTASKESQKNVQMIFKNHVPNDILKSIIDNTKLLLFSN